MKRHRPFVAAVFSLFLCISVFAQKMVFQGKVIDVIDGSTVVVETHTTSRFVVQCLAVKTPPPADSVSEDSRMRLASRVMGQTVTVEYLKPSENSRIVGTIFLNGDDVCLDQVRSGLAWFDREGQIGLSSSTRDVYATGEARARNSGVGLWGTSQTPKTLELNQPTTTSVPTSATGSTVDVRGYYRNDGTYVPAHKRTAPDESFNNNWSTVGNVNPYTGKPGTKSWFSRNWWIFPTLGALVGSGFLLHRLDQSIDGGIGIPCFDGTVSHAQHRQGACSHHGGIRQ
jgi:endonuclease YncB( thermonuclease family)